MAVHTQMEILLLSLTGHSVWSWHLTLDYIKHSLNVLSHEKLAYLVAQTVKNPPAMQETWVWPLGWKIPWRRERLPTPVFWPGESHGLYRVGHDWSDLAAAAATAVGFHCGSTGKESTYNVGDLGSIPGLEDPLEKGKATYSSILAWRIPWTV